MEEVGGRSPDLAERDVDVDQQVVIALLAERAAVGTRAGDKLPSLTLGIALTPPDVLLS
jgi:hypothetical protein